MIKQLKYGVLVLSLQGSIMLASEHPFEKESKYKNHNPYGSGLFGNVFDTVIFSTLNGVMPAFVPPVRELLDKAIAPIVSPIRTWRTAQYNIFILSHPEALTFDKLVKMQHVINSTVNTLFIDPASQSNKLLRRALVDGAVQQSSTNVYAHSIQTIIDHLENIQTTLTTAQNAYQQEAMRDSQKAAACVCGAVAGGVLAVLKKQDNKRITALGIAAGAASGLLGESLTRSPYSKEDLNKILFYLNQLQKQIDFIKQLIGNFNDLNQITDAKDEVTMLVKNLIAEIAHLCFVIEPHRAFEPKYRGLKLNYAASQMVDKAPVKGE